MFSVHWCVSECHGLSWKTAAWQKTLRNTFAVNNRVQTSVTWLHHQSKIFHQLETTDTVLFINTYAIICHHLLPPPLSAEYNFTVAMAFKNMGMDAASNAAMVTYIGGLHSPPVSQPTAIHQDIQLGEEEGTGWTSLRGGSSQARLALRIFMAQVMLPPSSSSAECG